MYPRKTSDLISRVASQTGVSEAECLQVINTFFKEFISDKIRNLEMPYFRIKNFGDFRISPYEALKGLRSRKNMVAKSRERLVKGERIYVSEAKLEQYEEEIEKLTNILSILTKIYGHEYMEKKFGEKYLAEQIPDYGGPKEQLIQKSSRRNSVRSET